MDDLISRQAAIDEVKFGITNAIRINRYTGEIDDLFQASNEELEKAIERIEQLPSVSVAEKVGYKDLWNKLYRYLNDMCLGIAPDKTTSIDESGDRMAQLDILDGILKWMNTEEVAMMRER